MNQILKDVALILQSETTLIICLFVLSLLSLLATFRAAQSYRSLFGFAKQVATVAKSGGLPAADGILALIGPKSAVLRVDAQQQNKINKFRGKAGVRHGEIAAFYRSKISRALTSAVGAPPSQEMIPQYDYVRASDMVVRLGLFFTFVGIAAALFVAVQSMSSPAQMQQGIRSLLLISANKFWISAFALLCALIIRWVGDWNSDGLSTIISQFQPAALQPDVLKRLAVGLSMESGSGTRRWDDAEVLGREIAAQFNTALKAMTEAYDQGFAGINVGVERGLTDALIQQREDWNEMFLGYKEQAGVFEQSVEAIRESIDLLTSEVRELGRRRGRVRAWPTSPTTVIHGDGKSASAD